LPLDLKNFLKMAVSVDFVSDGLMDSNYVWYTDVSLRDAGFLILIYFCFGRGRGIVLRTAETISMNLGRNEVLMFPYKCCCSH
jgi:hypothetical protein